MLICKSCGQTKLSDDFYQSNKARCKECVKASVRENRNRNAAYYRAYDRKRYREHDHRKLAAREQARRYEPTRRSKQKEYRERNMEKYKARNAVSNALRDGKLQRGTECFFCKSSHNLHAHHHDYALPLDVVWLCTSCHGKLHHINGDMRRAS